MKRIASDALRDMLPRTGSDGTRWALVDHISEIKVGKDSVQIDAVRRILEINKELDELLASKAGLLRRFPPPDSFLQFVKHSTLLQVAWDRGENHPVSQRIPFPQTFDDDVMTEITTIRGSIERLTGR